MQRKQSKCHKVKSHPQSKFKRNVLEIEVITKIDDKRQVISIFKASKESLS